jgi:hypothetical protein
VFTGQDKISEGYPSQHDTTKYFRTYRTGAHTAHGIGSPGHPGYNAMFNIVSSLPVSEPVLLSYGEIDCRVHVVTQAKQQGKTISEIICDVANRYSGTIREIHKRNNRVIIWCPVPTLNHYDPSAHIQEINPYPHIGTSEERNLATRVFEEELRKIFENDDIIVLSIFKSIVGSDLLTDGSYYMDGVHLSQKAFPIIVNVLNEEMKTRWGTSLL